MFRVSFKRSENIFDCYHRVNVSHKLVPYWYLRECRISIRPYVNWECTKNLKQINYPTNTRFKNKNTRIQTKIKYRLFG